MHFYRLMWRAKLAFALPVASALARHPALITKVLYGVQRIHMPASEWPPRSCELSSIAVAPEAAGTGSGKALIRAFLGTGTVDGCPLRIFDHRRGWQRFGQRVLSKCRISVHAAVYAAWGTLDERIRYRRPRTRQRLRGSSLDLGASHAYAADVLQTL